MPKNSYKGNRNIKKSKSTKRKNSRKNSRKGSTNANNSLGDFTKDLIGDVNNMSLNQMANMAQNPYGNPMMNPYIDPAMNSMGQNIDPSSIDPLHLNYMIPMDGGNYTSNNINNYGVSYDQVSSGSQTPMISNMGAPQMGAPQMGAPQMGAPQMGAMQMGAPQMGAMSMGNMPIEGDLPIDQSNGLANSIEELNIN